MTLRKRYEVIMEHITVTDEMRRRILANIQSPASPRRGRPTVRKMLAAAACLVLILAGAALLPRSFTGETVVPLEPVSYTHLDVYKRQHLSEHSVGGNDLAAFQKRLPHTLLLSRLKKRRAAKCVFCKSPHGVPFAAARAGRRRSVNLDDRLLPRLASRRPHNGADRLGDPALLADDASHVLRADMQAVSYTHLDVYKRQSTFRRDS